MTGRDLERIEQETGGHRIQRVPPTERRGRVHSSTVTVAVINPQEQIPEQFTLIGDEHFRVEWFSGSGAGGQHRNKHQNCCRLFHTPTGLVEARQGRHREANLRDAKEALLERLKRAGGDANARTCADERRMQVGSGMRGDKTITLRFQADQAIHHETGRAMSATRYMKGFMDEIW